MATKKSVQTKKSTARRTVKKQAPAKAMVERSTKSNKVKTQAKAATVKKVRGKKETLSKGKKADAAQRSQAFKVTRANHSMEAAEDYTELVHDLTESLGEARIVSIAANLGVSHVTALRTVRRLTEEGFLDTSPHKPVVLTAKGKRLAKVAKQRHEIVKDFLIKLGASKSDADADAEGIEHHVSASTLKAMKRFIAS